MQVQASSLLAALAAVLCNSEAVHTGCASDAMNLFCEVVTVVRADMLNRKMIEHHGVYFAWAIDAHNTQQPS